MNKKDKGDFAELRVASELISSGWNVLFPYGEDNRYDLVAEKTGVFRRIQVKYVTPKNGALDANCRSSNNWSVMSYTPEDIDILAVYDSISTKIYFVPVGEINKNTFKLRLLATKNNQRQKIHLAEQYSELS